MELIAGSSLYIPSGPNWLVYLIEVSSMASHSQCKQALAAIALVSLVVQETARTHFTSILSLARATFRYYGFKVLGGLLDVSKGFLHYDDSSPLAPPLVPCQLPVPVGPRLILSLKIFPTWENNIRMMDAESACKAFVSGSMMMEVSRSAAA